MTRSDGGGIRGRRGRVADDVACRLRRLDGAADRDTDVRLLELDLARYPAAVGLLPRPVHRLAQMVVHVRELLVSRRTGLARLFVTHFASALVETRLGASTRRRQSTMDGRSRNHHATTVARHPLPHLIHVQVPPD